MTGMRTQLQTQVHEPTQMLVLALPGQSQLAVDLAAQLHCGWSELSLHRFPDGEARVRIDTPVEGLCVVLAGSLQQPDEKTLPLIFAADAARDLGAARVGLAAPYLAYMRQDARFNPGEAISSRSYARLLSSVLDFLVTVDPHLHRWKQLEDIYTIPARAVPAAPAIARWVRANVPDPMLVGPDAESAQWVSEVARMCDAPWTVMQKTRRGDRDVSVEPDLTVSWSGYTPVLVDDIVSTGHTLVAAAQALREVSQRAPVCVAVHALLDAGASQRMAVAGIARFFSCDSIAHASNAIALAPSIAQAILEVTDASPAARPGL